MRVSVAMTTFNGGKFIREQLDSILRQTQLPSELVICDDGSTDDTPGIVSDFASIAPFPVRFSRNERRLGWRRNFLRSATRCEGEFIAFCDQDDVWLPNKLELQSKSLSDQSDGLLCYHNALVTDGNGNSLGRNLYPGRKDDVLDLRRCGPFSNSAGFTQMFSRKLLLFAPFFNQTLDEYDESELMPHDTWMFWLAMIFGSVVYIGVPLARYRRHTGTATGPVPTSIGRFYRKMTDRSVEYRRLAVVWRNRLELSKALAEFVAERGSELGLENARERATQAILAYEKLIERGDRRRALYEAQSTFRKIDCLVRNTASGDYSWRNAWAFPIAGLARDVVMAFAPAVRG